MREGGPFGTRNLKLSPVGSISVGPAKNVQLLALGSVGCKRGVLEGLGGLGPSCAWGPVWRGKRKSVGRAKKTQLLALGVCRMQERGYLKACGGWNLVCACGDGLACETENLSDTRSLSAGSVCTCTGVF